MKTVMTARKMQAPEYSGYLPELEVGEVCELNDLWDGNGDVSAGSYSYQLTDSDWINYEFEVIEKNDNNLLDTVIRITKIELI